MYFSSEKIEFKNLPYEAQIARLSDLAARAIAYYGLVDATTSLISYTNNAVFYVEARTGEYALRLHRAGMKPLAWLRSELIWLRTLGEAEMLVPFPASDIYMGALADEPLPVYCTLTTWLAGEHRAFVDMTDEQIRAVGRFIGRLHNASAEFIPPANFSRPRLDYEGLFGEDSPYDPKDGARIFTQAQKAVMAEVQARIAETFAALGESAETFGLIHADLIPKNLIWDYEAVGAIDFDDCGYGYYLYDLAPLLWMHRNEPNYAHLRDMVWDGYTESRSQPQARMAYLQTFVAARHVASCRWIAGNLSNPSVRARAEQIIAERVAEMKFFLMQPNDQ